LATQNLELWGGLECTVNRVQERFHSQLHIAGHHARLDDLDRFAALGIRRLRYPVLWEHVAPDSPTQRDWRFADERLARLRALEVDPIVGLLHHGSGPRYTHLLDPSFPELFAQYASAVATRFPWVRYYTPVNEPLTTARFSALYGLWYPHGSNDASFVAALINQCRATVLAMRAIRQVNPAAELIQTDDLGRTRSTRLLAYQASFDNERRWLAWDLMSGRVDNTHALRKYLLESGAQPEALAWLEENPCVPDIIGINHYITSDRYLDQRVERYAPATHGGNGKHRYADVEAVRVLRRRWSGIADALEDAWSRYGRPLAITEAHLGCSREEQVRWLNEVWDCATQARANGVDVRAVTAWALLGSFDWNSLLTRFTGHYEPGAFDVRGRSPRATALAATMRRLSKVTQTTAAAFAAAPGWWHRDQRLFKQPAVSSEGPRASVKPILITGATGTLGQAFARICATRGLEHRLCSRAELNICDADSIEHALGETHPWAVINTAGYVRVDDAERDSERCYRENSFGAALLARVCADRNIPFVTFSSDLVFDGAQQSPYIEQHAVRPLNVYGLSKARAERQVMSAHPGALVVRTSSFFGPWDAHNFVSIALRTLAGGQHFVAADDLIVSPTYVPDLVNATLDLLIDGEHGIWHLANRGSVTWSQLATQAATLARISSHKLEAKSWRELGLTAKRPTYSALTSERGLLMPELDDALARYVAAVG
jgi:dTDP-4-dehydrorhamnose reductase